MGELVEAIQDRGGGRFLAALYAVADHSQVSPVLRRVTDRRLRYLGDTYAALGLSANDAPQWALHAYATYIGFHHLLRTGLADAELARLSRPAPRCADPSSPLAPPQERSEVVSAVSPHRAECSSVVRSLTDLRCGTRDVRRVVIMAFENYAGG